LWARGLRVWGCFLNSFSGVVWGGREENKDTGSLVKAETDLERKRCSRK
jgi:hypothetical protein